MPILSKLAYEAGMPMLTTNCYETFHTWNPDCTMAIVDAIPDGLLFATKTYASFYLIATLVSKRDPRKINWKRYFLDTMRSSIFLCTNLVLYAFFFCRIRKFLGFFTPFTFGGLSSFMASFCAILIEKQNRRPALALYLINLASETYFRHLVNQGYLKSYKYGECVPFAAGLMIFMRMYNNKTIDSSMKKFLNVTHRIEPEELPKKFTPNFVQRFLQILRTKYSKASLCEHKNSCVSVVVETFIKNFTIGLGVSSGLILLKNLKNLIMNPLKVLRSLTSSGNMKIPMFFSLMPLLFHCCRCILNRIPNTSAATNNIISAGISSLSMTVYPNVTVAMYTMWKAIEAAYRDLADRGVLPYVKHGDIMLYTIGTGYVLWMASIETQSVRKGYQSFLSGLTGGRIRLFNRTLFDHFGYQSSKVFNHTPKLNTKFVTINPALYQPLPHF